MSSNIEWTDETWNPVNGCGEVSPGCAHCYAKAMAERLKRMGKRGYENGFELSIAPWQLSKPAKMAKTRKIFVNSMSDLFHEDIPPRYVSHVISAMIRADWHIYQVLTKRPEIMLQRLRSAVASEELARHMWWGVSVENKRHGLPRVDMLRDAPVARRFLSIEPLLEDLGEINLDGIGWVIVGGESGTAPTVRPMRPEWVRSIRDQCLDADVPFFFKQWARGDGLIRRLSKTESQRSKPVVFSARESARRPLDACSTDGRTTACRNSSTPTRRRARSGWRSSRGSRSWRRCGRNESQVFNKKT